MDLKDSYNLLATEWTKKHYGGWGQESVDKFISLFPKGSAILDLGCGSGIRTKDLADAGMNVLGIDFAERMVDIAKEDVPSAKFDVFDVRNIEKLKNKFDGIFAMAILLHFPKKEVSVLLKKIISLIKDDGYLYLALKERKGREKEEKIIKKDVSGMKIERFFSLYKLDEVKSELEKLNLKIVYEEILKMRTRNWIIVIAKK